jgi:SpoVK/Ycf46/Vps4 family AAA+-type ATPase
VVLATRDPWARPGRAVVNVDAAKPSTEEQQHVWREALTQEPERAAQDAATLASHFNLNVADIRGIAAQADGAALAPLWDSALRHARPALDQLAQRIDPVAGWDDLQLPEAETALLRQIAGQVAQRGAVYDDWGFRARMNRGLGISALFAGDSGTGKTMAAEAIARELNLLIYRIDLSAVVSKFIGETEKNLRKLFDGAEDSGAILFFDEADALFGKRSEVKDSHDRYANIEVNYLLQRMEAYRGLAILASNRKGALDNAFLRRLRFIVNFPMPAPAQRERIWRRIVPPETPLEELDWARLAQFGLSGGSIHNAALNAAFLAAGAGRKVGMPLVLEAIRGELRKLEKPVSEADFRWLAPAEVRS